MHELLQRWARAIHEGRAPHPQTLEGLVFYGVLGLAIGFWISNFV